MRLLALLFLCLIITSVTVSATQVTLSNSEASGIHIDVPGQTTITEGQDANLTFHLYNLSSGAPFISAQTNCTFKLFNGSGQEIISTPSFTITKNEFSKYVTGNNFVNGQKEYYWVQCTDGVLGGHQTIDLDIKSQGAFSLFLILAIGAILVLCLAFLASNEYFGMFSGFLFIITGVYGMVAGISGLTDDFTRMISIISIGLGLILFIAAAYQLSSNKEDE